MEIVFLLMIQLRIMDKFLFYFFFMPYRALLLDVKNFFEGYDEGIPKVFIIIGKFQLVLQIVSLITYLRLFIT